METVTLKDVGTLWSWTIQGFAPKPPFLGETDPQRFEPYGVGYIHLDGQLRIESRLTVANPDQLEIGMTMRLVPDVLAVDDDGAEIVTFAFEPAPDSVAAGERSSS